MNKQREIEEKTVNEAERLNAVELIHEGRRQFLSCV